MLPKARITALTAALIISAAACGGGSKSAKSSPPVKYGMATTLSGPAASIGTDQRHGIELAIDQLNAKDGVLGSKIELDAKDDKGDPTAASQVVRQLIDQDQVKVMFGPTLSSPTLAVIPLTTAAKVTESGTAVAVDAGDATKFPYYYRQSPVATLQASTFVAFMKAGGLKKAGLLAVNNALGTSNVDALKAAIKDQPLQIVGTQFHESGAIDLTPQVTKLRDAGADALLLLNTSTPDQIAGIKARNATNWDVPVLGFSTLATPAVTSAVGAAAMNKVYAGQAYQRMTVTGATPATKDFITALKKKLGVSSLTTDAQQSAVGYDAVMMWADAVKKTKSFDADKIRQYREANPYSGVANQYVYDAKRHDGVTLDDLTFVVASTVQDGLLVAAPK